MPLSKPALGIVLFAVINGLIAQALESYTAHGLVEVAGDYAPTLYHMSAKYHMWHVLTLFFVAVFYDRIAPALARKLLLLTTGLFCIGTILFSGGMYGVPFGVSVYYAAAGAVVLNAGWVVFVGAAAVAFLGHRQTVSA